MILKFRKKRRKLIVWIKYYMWVCVHHEESNLLDSIFIYLGGMMIAMSLGNMLYYKINPTVIRRGNFEGLILGFL